MTASMTLDELHLISFDICPYVQRAVILLNEKNAPYKTSYIDLAKKPDWFLKISPMGKVPVLDVGGTAIFESSAICEFIDETHAHRLHPKDALQKAKHRAWMEFSSTLIQLFYEMQNAQTAQDLAPRRNEIDQKLRQLEKIVVLPYFGGPKFAMVDAFFAPVFRYIQVYENAGDTTYLRDFPKLKEWGSQIMRRSSVIQSSPEDYWPKLVKYLKDKNSYYLTKLNVV